MSKTVGLKIDGKDVNVPEGTNLIDAAESAGIHIPNLCYIKGMRGVGACRLCLVEVEGAKTPVVACTTRAKDGMNVNTLTESISEMRKFVVDLILSMHPLDCMTCTKAGVCNLQKYAYDFELKESTFSRKKFGYPVDEANPFIKRDPDYCILCGRCVRVCKEQGTNVLDFMGRGVGARVITAMDKPLQGSECTFCGSCVDACPVNALLEADRWRKGREWEYEKVHSACLFCGNGCDIEVSTKDGVIVKVKAGAAEGSAEKYICAIGRFGFDSVTSDTRVTVPMKRTGSRLKETTWEDALKTVAEKLKKYGKKSGFICSADLLNEDASVLSKLAGAVKTKNVSTTVSFYADADSMKLSDSANMDSADLILLVGLNPSQWGRVLPALDASIRKRVARGARLVVVNLSGTGIEPVSAITVRGDEATSLAQIARALIEKGSKAAREMESALSGITITEEAGKAAEAVAGANYPVLFCTPSLFKASKNLSLLGNIRVIAVPFEANARGVTAAGLVAGESAYSELVSGKPVDLLYVAGDIPVTERPDVDFLVVQTPHMTGLAKGADVVLPAAAFYESDGTIIDYMGRTKNVVKAVSAPAAAKQHKDIFVELSKIMKAPIKGTSRKAGTTAKKSTKQKISPFPFEKQKDIDVNPSEFADSVNRCVINHSRLLWLKETEKALKV